MHFHLGPAGDTFAGALGVVTALLLLGGPFLLRWQRNRQQYLLVRAALEKGVTDFPKGAPFWLLSLRQGVMTLTLGVALLIVGSAGYFATRNITEPAIVVTPMTIKPAVAMSTTAVPAVATPATSFSVPTPPAPPAAGPEEGPARPVPNPAMEEWHRLKSVNTLGMASGAVGFVLCLLGTVRILFSRTERHYFTGEMA